MYTNICFREKQLMELARLGFTPQISIDEGTHTMHIRLQHDTELRLNFGGEYGALYELDGYDRIRYMQKDCQKRYPMILQRAIEYAESGYKKVIEQTTQKLLTLKDHGK
jgi:hypothetical protein